MVALAFYFTHTVFNAMKVWVCRAVGRADFYQNHLAAVPITEMNDGCCNPGKSKIVDFRGDGTRKRDQEIF